MPWGRHHMRSAVAALVVYVVTAACAMGAIPVSRPFIVVTTSPATARSLARAEARRGVRITQRFSRVLTGFSARLSPSELKRVRASPTVRRVDLDRIVHVVQEERRASATGL